MILTLYYMAATCLQWYRLGRMKLHLTQTLAICGKASENEDVSRPSCSTDRFLNTARNEVTKVQPILSKGVIFFTGTYDESAENQKLGGLLCYQDDRRACIIIPQKRIDLSYWISFPRNQNLFPLELNDSTEICQYTTQSNMQIVYLLLTTDINRATNVDDLHMLKIEQLGVPLAWRADTHMAIILKSDLQSLIRLGTVYMSKAIAVNDKLHLLRIETITVEGKMYELRSKDITPGMQWARHSYCTKQWSSHVVQLRSLCSTVKHRVEDRNLHKANTKKEKPKCYKDNFKNKVIDSEKTKIVVSEISSPESKTQKIEDNIVDNSKNGNLNFGATSSYTSVSKPSDSDRTDSLSIPTNDRTTKKQMSKTEKYEDKIKKYLKPYKLYSDNQKQKINDVSKKKREKSYDKKGKSEKSPEKSDKTKEKHGKSSETDKRDSRTARHLFRTRKHSEKISDEGKHQKSHSKKDQPIQSTEILNEENKTEKKQYSEESSCKNVPKRVLDIEIKSVTDMTTTKSLDSLKDSKNTVINVSKSAENLMEIEFPNNIIVENIDSTFNNQSSTSAPITEVHLIKVKRETSHSTVKLPTINVNDKKVILDEESSGNKHYRLSSKLLNDTTSKPPNVLVYADSTIARENVIAALNKILHKDKYTVYGLSPTSVWWGSRATLLVVCGAVTAHLGTYMLDYLLIGGRMLCLCSDFINIVLPTFTTAEVRERELVRFSYDRWHRVRMIHHIFCYQPSPGRKLFSKDSSEEVSPNNTRCATPSAVDVKDSSGKSHTLEVKVLGAEDTWQTPSIILASIPNNTGRAVFSQVHLEVEPNQYELDEDVHAALTESNSARIDILRHILDVHLGLDCSEPPSNIQFSSAYFLGNHELKLELLSRLAPLISENILKTSQLRLHFCGKGIEPSPATSTFLPVLLHSCPARFSTVDYFDTLETKKIGRLVIYSDVMGSSMDILNGCKIEHGLVAVCRQQTKGVGRGGNAWLSPEGCAMFSVQLHIPLNSELGQRISLIQLLVAVAVVSSVKTLPGYETIDIGLKWPNDIYSKGKIKIGGLIINSVIESSTAICNIGVGINLSNSNPTTCINDLIEELNKSTGVNLKRFTLEKFLAIVFNELEKIIHQSLNGDLKYFYKKYYEYWLHSDAEVTIVSPNGTNQQAIIKGVDKYGFLEVTNKENTFSVHPDGNSFDMLVGLIAPKLQ